MFSCVGNALVLWVLLKYEILRSLTNAFLLSLAVSDLVFTVGLPFWAYYNIIGHWTFGEPACKAITFKFFVGFYSSTIFLITMTVYRYMAVVHPLAFWNSCLRRKMSGGDVFTSTDYYFTTPEYDDDYDLPDWSMRRKMSGGDVFTTTDYYFTSPEYDDDYDVHGDICPKVNVVQFGAIVTPVFFTVVVMFSCVGNALVLWVLLKYENLRSLTNAFLLNLAVSDLVFTVGLPFWAYYHVTGQWIFGEPACKAVSFIFFVGFYSSTIFLITMTVHRYMAVVRPLSVILNRRIYHCMFISVVIWILSFCTAAPHAIFNEVMSHATDDDNSSKLYCDYENVNWKLVGIYQQNLFFIIAFIIITFCYTQILGRLLRPTAHTRRKTIRLVFCIVVVYFLGWAPYNVAIFLDSLIAWNIAPFNECDVSTVVDYIYYVSRLVAFSHCCLNPIFHVFMGIKFRSHLKKMLWNISGSNDEPQNRHSNLIYSNGEEISMY
ncbi:hypothetical protein MHYP_G00238260 [Metynnis hypsauchen]